MSIDLREQFLGDVVNSLIMSEVNSDTINLVRSTIALQLQKYQMSSASTEVVVRDNESEQLMKLYIGTMMTEGKRKKTLDVYYRTIQRFHIYCGKPLKEVTKIDILSWIAEMRQRVDLTTCENYRQYVASFYKWMYNEEIISKNPMQTIKRIKRNEKAKHPFSETDIDKIRLACSCPRDRAIVEVLLSSGLRCEELCQLDISDVNLRTLELLVRDGKGGKQRVVYINELAAYHLSKYLDSRKDNYTFLFVSRKHCRICSSGLRFILKKLEKQGGVYNVHPHRFRTTFATICIENGMDIRTLQILMGHTDISTTMGYVVLTREHLKIQYQQCV